MIVIYHNPSSKNSRDCLEILETNKHDHQVIKHQEKPLQEGKLIKIINLLDVALIELIKTKSKFWKQKFKHFLDDDIEFSKNELVKIMIEYPDLIEIPIIINSDKAVIGKPAKKYSIFSPT